MAIPVREKINSDSESDNENVDKKAATLVPASDTKSKCGLCHRGHVSHPLEAGKLFRISSGECVHYFCMLFTAYASQVGGDEEGLYGFYSSEVVKQISLAKKKKCFYCGLTGATSRCAKKYCSVTMHFQCGVEEGAIFQFHTKNMYTFCSKVNFFQSLKFYKRSRN